MKVGDDPKVVFASCFCFLFSWGMQFRAFGKEPFVNLLLNPKSESDL